MFLKSNAIMCTVQSEISKRINVYEMCCRSMTYHYLEKYIRTYIETNRYLMYRAPSNFSRLCSLLCNPEGDSDAFCSDLICSSCKQHPWLFQWRRCKDQSLVGSLPMLCYLVDYDNIKCQLMGFIRINDSIGYEPKPELQYFT